MITKERLEKLGLSKAASEISRAERLTKAYNDYTVMTQDRIDAFNRKLKEDTIIENGRISQYKQLTFIPLNEYEKVPPTDVLEKLEKAQETKIFDTFEVCKVEWIREVKDPIIFGRIKGCNDRFYIAQWDNDISLTDLVSFDTTNAKSTEC
jgi:hypothetical protein